MSTTQNIKMQDLRNGFVSIHWMNEPTSVLLPYGRVRGLTRLQIVELCEAGLSAYAELDKLTAKLAETVPGVSFGYIGNISATYDDRAFTVFFPHPNRMGEWKDRSASYAWVDLPQMVKDWDLIVRAALEHQRCNA